MWVCINPDWNEIHSFHKNLNAIYGMVSWCWELNSLCQCFSVCFGIFLECFIPFRESSSVTSGTMHIIILFNIFYKDFFVNCSYCAWADIHIKNLDLWLTVLLLVVPVYWPWNNEFKISKHDIKIQIYIITKMKECVPYHQGRSWRHVVRWQLPPGGATVQQGPSSVRAGWRDRTAPHSLSPAVHID